MELVFLPMGLAMGLLNTNLWNYMFDNIFPYLILLDPSWKIFISIWG